MAKMKNGAPGVDGVTFEAFKELRLEVFLEWLRGKLLSGDYPGLRLKQ